LAGEIPAFLKKGDKMSNKKNVSLSEMGCGTIEICKGLVVADKIKLKTMRMIERKMKKPLAMIDFNFIDNMIPLIQVLAEQAGNKLSESKIEELLEKDWERTGSLETVGDKLSQVFAVNAKNSPKSNPKKA